MFNLLPYQLRHLLTLNSSTWRSQAGIAHLAVLFLLLAGIGLGTYLVQNRTNLFPNAACLKYEDDGSCSVEEPDPEPEKPSEQPAEPPATEQPAQPPADNEGCGAGTIPEPGGGCRDTRLNPDGSLKENPDGSQETPQQPNPGDQEGLSPSDGKTTPLKNCGAISNDTAKTTCEADNEKIAAKNNDTCSKDRVTYCDGGAAWRKTSGTYNSSSGKCDFDFYPIAEKNSECDPKKGAKDGDVVSISAQEAATKDLERAITKGQDESDNSKCKSMTVCIGGKRVLKSSVDKPDGGCTEEQTFNTNSSEGCIDASGKPKPNNTIVGGDSRTQADLKIYEQGQQRIVLKQQIDEARAKYDPNGLKNRNDDKLIEAFSLAQEFLDEARLKFDKCFSEPELTKEACQSVAEIDQTRAVMASRVALLKAAEAGISGVRVKADLAVGGTTNPLMIARPNDGKGGYSRIFLVTDENKKANYFVRNSEGTLVPANPNDLKKYNLTQGQDTSSLGAIFENRLEKAKCGVDGTCPGQKPATPAQPGQPAQTSDKIPDPNDKTANPNGSDIFRSVDRSLCGSDCDGQNDICKQGIPNYPSNQGIYYKCMKNFRATTSDEARVDNWGILKNVSNDQCYNVCSPNDKCMLRYVSPSERVTVPNQASYIYACFTKDTPEGRIIPKDSSVTDGLQCSGDKQCKSGKCQGGRCAATQAPAQNNTVCPTEYPTLRDGFCYNSKGERRPSQLL